MGGFVELLERTASVLSILAERPKKLPPIPSLISPHVRGGDIYTVVLVTTILLMVRLALDVSLLPALLPKTMRRSRQRKVSENVFYTIFYLSTTILGYVVYTREPWSLNLFSNEPQVLPLFSPFPAPLSPLMRMYFLTELGFYVGALLFLIVDEHRKDFAIMVVHHVVSICLVVGSYLGGWVRFGAIVLALHDVGDVFLYAAKAAHNLGGCYGADTGSFVLFAVTFYVTRCVFFLLSGLAAGGLGGVRSGEGVSVLVRSMCVVLTELVRTWSTLDSVSACGYVPRSVGVTDSHGCPWLSLAGTLCVGGGCLLVCLQTALLAAHLVHAVF